MRRAHYLRGNTTPKVTPAAADRVVAHFAAVVPGMTGLPHATRWVKAIAMDPEADRLYVHLPAAHQRAIMDIIKASVRADMSDKARAYQDSMEAKDAARRNAK